MATLSGPNTKDASGASVSKLIRAYHRETGVFLGEVASSPVDGSWSMSFPGYSAGTKCFAICHDGIGFANNANVVLALDFEGGSIVDRKGHSLSIGSGATQSTSYPAGGTKSCRLDGTANGYLSFANHADFVFSNSKFEILIYVRWDGSPGRLFSNGEQAGSIWPINEIAINGDGSITWVLNTSNGSGYTTQSTSAGAVTANTLIELLFSRHASGVHTIHVAGTKVKEFTWNNTLYNASNGIVLGAVRTSGGFSTNLACYIDNFRLAIGASRMYDNYTPSPVFVYDALPSPTENALIYDYLSMV